MRASMRPNVEQDYILQVDATEMRQDEALLKRMWSHWEASEPVVIRGVVPGISWDPNVSSSLAERDWGIHLGRSW